MLNEPTVSDLKVVPAVPVPASATLPPPRRPRRAEATSSTASGGGQRNGGFLTFLLAILVAAGLLALIGWQAAPWLLPPARTESHAEQKAAPTDSQPVSQPASQPAAQSPPETAPAAAEAPADPLPLPPQPTTQADSKPSPMGQEPKRERAVEVVRGPPQDVQVTTSPAGATARLDRNPAISCTTPCTLTASPGKHIIAISLPSYMVEVREVFVGTGPMEMAPVTMRALTGTLMLVSVPPGATITVNGRRMGDPTPASLGLPAGSYQVTVEKDGRQASDTIEVKEGLTTYRRIVLVQ